MKSLLLFLSLYSAVVLAQTPQWTLLRKNTSGVIAVDPTDSKTIYISGVLKTTDGGLTWAVHLDGFNLAFATDVIVDPNNPQVVYVCGYGLQMGLVKSTNGGLAWTKSDTGIVTDHHGYSLAAIALDAKRNILYAGDFASGGGAYRSLDGGKRWELLTKAFSTYDLLIDEKNGIVYAGTANGVWKSHDQGRTWIRISKGLPINSINPFSGDTLYHDARSITMIKKSNTLYAALWDNGIYKSYDAGKNWLSINSTLTNDLTLNAGVVVSHLDTNVVYTGGFPSLMKKSGIFRSLNGGQTWEKYHNGFPSPGNDNVAARFLAYDYLSNTLYGIFCIEVNDSSQSVLYKLRPATPTPVVENSKNESPLREYHLFQNYPNPFKSETMLEYKIKGNEIVNLIIYDVTGKEVKELVYKSQPRGDYQIVWNGKNTQGGDVPSGVYLIQLKTGTITLTQKILLIR